MKNWMILLIISIILGLIIFFRKKINKLVMFDLIMNIILKHEGGYVNDPDDLGGETKYGISKRSFPSIDIKNLTKSEAIELYRQNYFVPLEIDKFDNVNLALQFMDMAVNAGIKNAKNIMTISKEIKKTSPKSLLSIYKEQRIVYYKKIALLRNNQKYLAGWLNRVKSNIV